MNEEVDLMTSDYISPNNNLEISNPTDSFHEPQNQEVVSTKRNDNCKATLNSTS